MQTHWLPLHAGFSSSLLLFFHMTMRSISSFQLLSLDDIKEAKNIDLKEDEDDSKREVFKIKIL